MRFGLFRRAALSPRQVAVGHGDHRRRNLGSLLRTRLSRSVTHLIVALSLALSVMGPTLIGVQPAAAGPTISAVGSLATADGVGLTTLSVNPQNVGDVLEVFAMAPITSVTLSSVSGGGVSTWTKAVQFDGSIGSDEEIWFGQVNTTGSSTITFAWSGSISGHTMEYGSQEFTAGLGSSTVWSVDRTGTTNGSSSTSVPFPSLTPSGSGELYFGYSCVFNTASAGSTSGFSYAATAEGNMVIYDPNVSAAVSPSAAQSPAGISSSLTVVTTASSYVYHAPSVVGDVYSIAGTGAAGTSGNNAQATEAELNDPVTTAVDALGDVYEADEFNSRIQEIAATTHSQWGISMVAGDVYTVAGSSSGSSGHSGNAGAATSALLASPSGVAVDAAGNLYISDQGNNRIQEVAAATGTQWGISMTANDIYTIAGSSTGSSGHSGNAGAATSALLNQPRNTAFDAAGNLYISDMSNNRIQLVAKTTCSSACPFGLASTTANDIYTIAGSSTGSSGSTGDGGAATSALFNTVKGLGFDAAGNLYVADYTNNRIQEVAVATGTQWGVSMTANDVYTVAGSSSGSSGSSGDGGAATSALLNQPRGVAVDAAGDLYIADGTNNRLQEVAAPPAPSGASR